MAGQIISYNKNSPYYGMTAEQADAFNKAGVAAQQAKNNPQAVAAATLSKMQAEAGAYQVAPAQEKPTPTMDLTAYNQSMAEFNKALEAYQNDINKYGKASTIASTSVKKYTPTTAAGVTLTKPTDVTGQELGAYTGPTAATIADQDALREKQLSFLTSLENQMAGKVPSVAQLQLQQALESNAKQAMATTAAQRGLGAGSAARQISQNLASSNQAMSGQAALLRAQEQQNLQSLYGTALSGTREQDYAKALAQAQLQQQAGLMGSEQSFNKALQEAQMRQQATLANQSVASQYGLTQGQLDAQTQLANQEAMNTASKLYAEQQMQRLLANQSSTNQANQLRLQSLSNILGSRLGQSQLQQQAAQAQAGLGYQYSALAQAGNIAQQQQDTNILGSILSGAGGILGAFL